MLLERNVSAPEFSLPDESGRIRKLSDYKGRPLVLYFYPKDDTPGCTKEACNFRDDYSAFLDAGVEIIGISPDSPKSHKKFKDKYDLPFSLLADERHEICELYGVWDIKKMMGREYYGVLRTTYILDKNGKITRVFAGVKPSVHSKEVLNEVSKLS